MLLGGEMSASRSLGVCVPEGAVGAPVVDRTLPVLLSVGRGALSVMSEKCGMMMLRKVAVAQSSGGKKSRLLVKRCRDNAPRVINRRDRAIECAPCC